MSKDNSLFFMILYIFCAIMLLRSIQKAFLFALGLLLLLLQGSAKFIRDAYFALRGESLD